MAWSRRGHKSPMQHPILAALDGGAHDLDAASWDAQASADIAALVAQYLTTNPPPATSLTAGHWYRTTERLRSDAESRRAALGQAAPQQLRAV